MLAVSFLWNIAVSFTSFSLTLVNMMNCMLDFFHFCTFNINGQLVLIALLKTAYISDQEFHSIPFTFRAEMHTYTETVFTINHFRSYINISTCIVKSVAINIIKVCQRSGRNGRLSTTVHHCLTG